MLTKFSPRLKDRERSAWMLAGLASALAAVFAAYLLSPPWPGPLVRTALVLPEKSVTGDVAVSPDGTRVAFTLSDTTGRYCLWVRDLNAESARAIVGSEGAQFPFWSPDGRFLAFFADGKLKKLGLDDGALLAICDAAGGVGGTWNREGTIVFAPSPTSALFRVETAGGKPVAVTKLDATRHEVAHRYPSFLPDGEHFLYTIAGLGESSGEQSNAIWVGSLDGRENKALVDAFSNAQFASRRLVYARDGALLAQRLDLGRLVVEGEPVVIAPQVIRTANRGGHYTFSASSDALVLATQPTALSRSLDLLVNWHALLEKK